MSSGSCLLPLRTWVAGVTDAMIKARGCREQKARAHVLKCCSNGAMESLEAA